MQEERIFKDFPRERKTKKSVSTQLRIMDAYISLIEETDFDRVTVLEIVKKAGITRTTFYVYFDDIYDVIEYIEESLIAHLPEPQPAATERERGQSEEEIPMKKCAAPTWMKDWFMYMVYFQRQFRALLGPHGNPQFPHKVRKQIRAAHKKEMRLEGFDVNPFESNYLNAMADFHLKSAMLLLSVIDESMNKEALCSNTELFVGIVNTLRLGGLYKSQVERAYNVNLADMSDYLKDESPSVASMLS